MARVMVVMTLLLAVAASDGGATEWQLTILGTNNAAPSWSPDGNEIAFQSDRGGTQDIWVMDAAGEAHGLRQVTSDAWIDKMPDWSPDGSLIALESQAFPGGQNDVYTVDSRGSGYGIWQLTASPFDDGSPEYSPDGFEILFTSDRTGDWEVMVMDYRGEPFGYAWLTFNAAADFAGSWSPDGSYVCFTSNRDAPFCVWYMDSRDETYGAWKLTTGLFSDRPNAQWSPDGDLIAFGREGIGIAAYSFSSGLTYQVTADANDKLPEWSPDGTMIAFTRNDSEIWVTDNIPDTPVEHRSWGSIKAMFR